MRLVSSALRSVLVQGRHVLLFRCTSDHARPFRHLAQRVHTTRVRRKLAVAAAARFLLRAAFYVLRDGTSYEPAMRMRPAPPPPPGPRSLSAPPPSAPSAAIVPSTHESMPVVRNEMLPPAAN